MSLTTNLEQDFLVKQNFHRRVVPYREDRVVIFWHDKWQFGACLRGGDWYHVPDLNIPLVFHRISFIELCAMIDCRKILE